MTAQTMQKREVIAVYETRREADQAKKSIQDSGVMGQRIYIDDHVSPTVQVAAQGTTVGGQAGFFMGAFLGGVIGLIATIIITFWMTGDYLSTNVTRLAVIGSAIAGAVFGASVGKAIRAKQPAEEVSKGNPDLPRQYRLIVEGSQEEVRQAQQAVGQTPVTH